jgi:hypothetical protein
VSIPPSHFDYHSLHTAAPGAEAVRVDWRESQRRCDRLRVREHTCFCRLPMYELCTAGGLWFVRRFSGEALEVIVESTWMTARAAQRLWMQIVTGQAM